MNNHNSLSKTQEKKYISNKTIINKLIIVKSCIFVCFQKKNILLIFTFEICILNISVIYIDIDCVKHLIKRKNEYFLKICCIKYSLTKSKQEKKYYDKWIKMISVRA